MKYYWWTGARFVLVGGITCTAWDFQLGETTFAFPFSSQECFLQLTNFPLDFPPFLSFFSSAWDLALSLLLLTSPQKWIQVSHFRLFFAFLFPLLTMINERPPFVRLTPLENALRLLICYSRALAAIRRKKELFQDSFLKRLIFPACMINRLCI